VRLHILTPSATNPESDCLIRRYVRRKGYRFAEKRPCGVLHFRVQTLRKPISSSAPAPSIVLHLYRLLYMVDLVLARFKDLPVYVAKVKRSARNEREPFRGIYRQSHKRASLIHKGQLDNPVSLFFGDVALGIGIYLNGNNL
jgi:hypothetical protein